MTSRNVEYISEQQFLLFVPDRAKRMVAFKKIPHSRIRTINCVGVAGQLELIVCPSSEVLVAFLHSVDEADHAGMRFFLNEGHGAREIPRSQILSI